LSPLIEIVSAIMPSYAMAAPPCRCKTRQRLLSEAPAIRAINIAWCGELDVSGRVAILSMGVAGWQNRR
jgi:hypothetical protein